MATVVARAVYHKDVSSGTQGGSVEDPIILISDSGSGSSGDDADDEGSVEEEEEEDSEGCMSVIEDESED